jgi:CRP-like cAMP-binding protein
MMQRANRFFNMRGQSLDGQELEERLSVLRVSPVFGSVPRVELPILASMFDVRHYGDADVICRAGDPAGEMYVLLRGSPTVEVPGQSDARGLEHGEVIGEYGMFGNGTRTATVRAHGATVVLVLDYQRFQRFLLAFPESMQALLASTVQRLLALESKRADHTR